MNLTCSETLNQSLLTHEARLSEGCSQAVLTCVNMKHSEGSVGSSTPCMLHYSTQCHHC